MQEDVPQVREGRVDEGLGRARRAVDGMFARWVGVGVRVGGKDCGVEWEAGAALTLLTWKMRLG